MLLLHSQAPPSERETEKEANGDSRGPSESIARPSKCTFHSKTRLFIMRGCGSWRCEQGSRLTTQRLAGRAPVARFRSFPGGLWVLHAQSEAAGLGAGHRRATEGAGGSALSASIPTRAPHFWGIVSLHGWPEPLGLGPAAWLVPALGRAVATRMPACLSRPSGVRNTINCRGRGPGLRKRLTARCQHAGQLSSSAEFVFLPEMWSPQ